MKKTILIAAVMFFALSAVAMAQFVPGARYTVASVPETFVSCCGLTEKTGDIGFTAVPGSPDSVTGTITVTYAVPVTNNIASTYGYGIFASATPTSTGGALGVAPVVSALSATNVDGKGTVVISVGAGGIYPYTITLSGVRVNVSGSCGGSVSANITSTGNLLTSGETNVLVISNVKNALQTPTTSANVSINGVTGVQSSGSFTLGVKENFLDAFGKVGGTGYNMDPSATTSKWIRLAVTKVPVGVTLSFPVNSSGNLFSLVDSTGAPLTSNQAVNNGNSPASVYYKLATSSDAATLETMSVSVGVSNVGPYPLSGAPVTISAHVFPVSNSTSVIPRFTGPECETAAVQVLSIFGASTTLLVPYAVNQDVLFGYNTGFAIANTTTDPGTGIMGFKTAVKQFGKIAFYFYPQTGTPFSYATTAGSPGSGLSADGTLKSGGSYVALLDQLLAAAGAPKAFTGYIIIVTDFTNAHGQYFISDFEAFTNGALMLVLNNDSVGRDGPEKLDN
jgi:hypothetical protein